MFRYCPSPALLTKLLTDCTLSGGLNRRHGGFGPWLMEGGPLLERVEAKKTGPRCGKRVVMLRLRGKGEKWIAAAPTRVVELTERNNNG